MADIDSTQTTRPQTDRTASAALKASRTETRLESSALGFATSRVYAIRMRHPWLYGIAAFLLGGFIIGAFTMTTYLNWVYEGINLKVAFWQVILGSLGGGIAMALLAFAYARTIRPTLDPMRNEGIITD